MDNQPASKQLYRSRANRVIFGVCGGLGEYFDIDPVIVRVIFVLLTFGAGTGVLVYLILALVVPNAPEGSISGPAAWQQNDFGKRVQGLAEELQASERRHFGDRRFGAKNWAGLAIVLLGAMMLFNQIFPGHWLGWNFFWPTVFIIGGVLILTRVKK